MRIPPLYRHANWQRFFSGLAIGGCLSWTIFLFMFGVVQERNSILVQDQANRIKELTEDIKIWQMDYQELNEKNEEMLRIQEINIQLVQYEKYNIHDRQSIFSVQDSIKEDLKSLLTKDLATIYKNKDIIKKTIENKIVDINGKKYGLKIKEIHYYTTIDVEVELKLAD